MDNPQTREFHYATVHVVCTTVAAVIVPISALSRYMLSARTFGLVIDLLISALLIVAAVSFTKPYILLTPGHIAINLGLGRPALESEVVV